MKPRTALLGAFLLASTACAADLFSPPKDLMEGVPADFPRFYFAGHDTEAQWLSRYLWYHFSTRLGIGKVLFNQEYMTTADL